MVQAVVDPAVSNSPGTRAGMYPEKAHLVCYGIASASVAVAFALRSLLDPILHAEIPYLFFVPALLISAGIGGLGPGLAATALGLALGSFFIGGFPEPSNAELVNAATFAVIGVGIAWGGEQLQRS